MGAAVEIQRTLYATLRNDATLSGLLATDDYEGSPTFPAIYDHVPHPADAEDDTKFPYIHIGEWTSIEFDTDDTHGEESTVALHIWDRREGRLKAKQVRDAVKSLLHDATLSIAGTNAIYCFFESSESVPDPEPFVQHEVIRFRIVTMDS